MNSAVQFTDLKDKIILVTGAGRGIGKQICLCLAAQKAHVVLNYRGDSTLVEELKTQVESLGGKASLIKFDMSDTQQMKEAIKTFNKDVGLISGLVNNAGISKDGFILRLKESDLQTILDVNLKGVIMLTSILSRYFIKAENVSIVNMSSIVGLMGNAAQVPYSASKAGIIGFTKSYAKELAGKNVRCNAICPGFIETDMTDTLDEKIKESYLEAIPLNRMGTGQEVANLTAFLLSTASSYITGEVIKIDGGMYI